MTSTTNTFLESIRHRRTYTVLGNDTPIPDSEIEQTIRTCILHCPSTFNSQSTRAIVVFNAEHDKLWSLVIDVVQHVVPEKQFLRIKTRIDGFRGARGTVLLFEDQVVIDDLIQKMPQFADALPQWGEHTAGLHHYAIWTALDAAGLGCNLQHFNPMIDGNVQRIWGAPKEWSLKAQLVFGSIVSEPGEKESKSVEQRCRSYGMREAHGSSVHHDVAVATAT